MLGMSASELEDEEEDDTDTSRISPERRIAGAAGSADACPLDPETSVMGELVRRSDEVASLALTRNVKSLSPEDITYE